MIHVDTTFLVDLIREERRGKPGAASRFLETHPDEPLAASVFAFCELAAGAELAPEPAEERKRVARIAASVEVVYPDETLPGTYGPLLAVLQRSGTRIGTMDLLIGATAASCGAPLLTRNRKDFERIPGLRLVAY